MVKVWIFTAATPHLHQTPLQTVQIQMRRLVMSRLIRIYTGFHIFFILD